MITYEKFKNIAELSMLYLDEKEVSALARDISSIVDFTDAVAETAVGLQEDVLYGEDWSYREDIIMPSYPVEDVLLNAGEQQDGFFVARKKGGLTE